MDEPLKILIVDDSIFYRKILKDILSELPYVSVVGTASNGKTAMSRIKSLKPDILTLDIEMPVMNGLEVLYELQNKNSNIGAIILSSLTQKGSEMTIKALELGAFDFISKPEAGTLKENKAAIEQILAPMLKAYERKMSIHNIFNGTTKVIKENIVKKISSIKKITGIAIKRRKRHLSKIIAIGASTGGPRALSYIISNLPPDIGVPILIVQHMPAIFTESLAKSLNSKTSLNVTEAKDGQSLKPNNIYIAPGNKQMKVVKSVDNKDKIIRIKVDPPENSCKPSIDYLFRSIAQQYHGHSTGIIMTGKGMDGIEGLTDMKKTGARVIAQDEETSVVFGMPKKAVEAGIVDVIAPLEYIATEITKSIKPIKKAS